MPGGYNYKEQPVRNTALWNLWGCNCLIEFVNGPLAVAREPLIIVLRGGDTGGKEWPWPAELTTSVQLP